MKIKIQKKTDNLEQYIQNIKFSKIILSVMTLGVHFSMLFNKHLVALIGPNNYDDLKLYQKVTQILPRKRCRIHSRKLNINYSKCSCMKKIDENKIIKIISGIYEKIS
jgi:ADP-heptose:LPS heptosyltransferase